MENKKSTDLSDRLAYLQKLAPDISFEQVISWVFDTQVASNTTYWLDWRRWLKK